MRVVNIGTYVPVLWVCVVIKGRERVWCRSVSRDKTAWRWIDKSFGRDKKVNRLDKECPRERRRDGQDDASVSAPRL